MTCRKADEVHTYRIFVCRCMYKCVHMCEKEIIMLTDHPSPEHEHIYTHAWPKKSSRTHWLPLTCSSLKLSPCHSLLINHLSFVARDTIILITHCQLCNKRNHSSISAIKMQRSPTYTGRKIADRE